MIKINKTDQEILEILKEVFQLKRINPLNSDDNLRLWIIRSLFLISFVSIIYKAFYFFSDNKIDSTYSEIINTPIAIFFTLLFLHINNKSENSSLILFVLTWLSLMLTLFS